MAAFVAAAVTWLGYRAARKERQSQVIVVRQEKSVQGCEELAAASRDFVHVVKKLPGVDFGARKAILDEAFNAVRVAYNGVTFWGPPSVVSAADQLYACVERSEGQALARAVARSALSDLMEHWCPGKEGVCDGNAEVCTSSRHWSAFRAYELLYDWGFLDDYEQFDVREELEYALVTSDVLTGAELTALREVLNWGSVWREVRGSETRADHELRAALTAFVDGSRRELSVV
ncbi:hypothetical protein [Streptomyces sp. NPDC092952]|uniref:hypothetical protein n=1 Tax=Streptomyces sp. NPDC092952 TaxID=3366018 RepID=UPI00382CB06A